MRSMARTEPTFIVALVTERYTTEMCAYTNKNSRFKSIADLKGIKSPLKFASTGIGASTWVQASILGAMFNFPVKFVLGYKKLSAAALAVAKGDAVAGLGTARHSRGVKKDVRQLMFFGSSRDPFYPDVPSAGELGYFKLTKLGAPRIVTAPPGTPEPVLKVLRNAAKRATGRARRTPPENRLHSKYNGHSLAAPASAPPGVVRSTELPPSAFSPKRKWSVAAFTGVRGTWMRAAAIPVGAQASASWPCTAHERKIVSSRKLFPVPAEAWIT